MIRATQKVFLDFSQTHVAEADAETANAMLSSAFHQVEEAFRGTNVEIVLERSHEGDYSTLTFVDSGFQPDNTLGLAELDRTFNPSDQGIIRLDTVWDEVSVNGFTAEQTTNYLSSTVCHEIGHLTGLEHSSNPYDIMYPEANYEMTNVFPTFSPEQLHAINTNAVVANIDDSWCSQDAVRASPELPTTMG